MYATGGMDAQLGGGKKGTGLLGMLSPKELEPMTSDVTFDDVKGCDEAKGDLQEIADFLADPDRFTSLGGKLPKGVLLMGAPGTGKTLLARAIAGEAGVPFYYVSGAEFDEIFVGVGAKRVRELFRAAKANSPCIIFIDELDAVGGKRNAKDQRAMKQTVNQLLVELDGFEENDGLIVVGATNFPDSLDPALIRPGRFDRHVNVALPDIRGRKAILDLYMEKVSAECDEDGKLLVDTETLARGTPGMSGAELSNLVNAAAIKASTDGASFITQAHLEFARDKILMGSERKSAYITPENKKLTAYHEGGHAVVMLHTEGANKIHKATIMPRGRALGMVQQLQKGDQTGMTRKEMRAHIDVCMGGRVAEEIIFGKDEVTTGASSDFKQATNVAKQMVMLYGMSDKLGPMNIDPEQLYTLSDETRHAIDDEVMRMTSESYSRVRKLLHQKRGDLEKVAQGLLKYETLTGEELHDIVRGKAITR